MTTSISSGSTVASPAPSIKAKQQAMWASGDFSVIGTTLQIVGELLCEAVDLGAGERVLDVAAGNGNATLAAARRFARVTSTDYVPQLLERGKRRAEAEGLDVAFEVADAEALPYPTGSFDVVLSSFGVMFAPDHSQSANELMRVCRSGGRIALASWTPEGFLGQLFRVIAKHVPPTPGVPSPLLWGTKTHIQDLFTGSMSIEHRFREFAFRYRSPEHFVERVPRVLWADSQGLPGARQQRSSRAGGRHDRTSSGVRSRRCRRPRGAGRVSGDSHHQLTRKAID